ncbi:hypothetical protein H1R20_g14874, partial [Candolleomyces eurysporus]
MPTSTTADHGDQNGPRTQTTSPATQGDTQSLTSESEQTNEDVHGAPTAIRATLKDKPQRLLDPRLPNLPPKPNAPPPAARVSMESTLKTVPTRIEAQIKEESDCSSQGDASPAMLEVQKERVVEDLGNEFTCKYDFQRSLYSSLVTKQCIDEFIQSSDLYSKKGMNWVTINPFALDHPVTDASELVERVYTTIAAIMEQLGDCDGSRKLVKAGNSKLRHEEKYLPQGAGYSSPSLVIEAHGASFELPEHSKDDRSASTVGFTNVTTCIEVVLEDEYDAEEELEKHTVYARQMFIQQPNRQFARTFSITEERIHFFHSDRSGIHHGYIANYHHTPEPFIRLVIGLCSLDEEALGLDSSVQWTLDDTGRKASGSLTIRDDETEVTKTYDLASVRPVFKQYCLANRGTICWAVWDTETKEEYIVKDCWREEGAPAEFENLQRARNINGVVQMVSHEGNRRQTKDFGVSRYFSPKDRKKSSMKISVAQNLILSRVVMERYGRDIRYFESEKQLLCAIRDAIAGHRDLYLEGDTVHCDIDWTNILLGKPGAPPGKRGILIDLDCAKPIPAIAPQAQAVGHCMFFSLSLTRNAIADNDKACPKHDYLDDIEAGFYVTTALMHHRDGPLKPQEPYPEIMRQWWELKDYDMCDKNFEFKKKFLLSNRPVDPTKDISPYWSKASRHLLKRFFTFARKIARAKSKIRDCSDREVAERRLNNLLSEAKVLEHYNLVLHLFDSAIMELEKSEADTSLSMAKKRKRKMQDSTEGPQPDNPGRRNRRRR